MARGIEIPLVADTRDVIRGTDDVAQALDDVVDSLDDVDRASRDAGRELGQNVADGADTAGDAATDFERRMRDSLESVEDASRSTGQAVGRNVAEGADEAGEGLATVSEEGAATATEVAASFDGSAESIAGGFQELAANAFAGFGPAGAAAGIAVAAGMGLVMSKMEAAKEEAQEVAQGVSDIAANLIDLGDGRAVRSGDQINERLKELASTAEEGDNALQGISDTADDLGLDFQNLARAMAGDSESAALAIAEINAEMSRLGELNNAAAGAAYNSAAGQANATRRETINQLNDQREAIADANNLLDEGTEIYDLYASAVVDSASAQEAATEAAEGNAAAIRDAASAALEASNAEIGYQASLASTTATIAENGQTLDLATEAGRNNQSALNDLAAATLGAADANKINGAATAESNDKLIAGREAFINAAVAAGQTREAASLLADQFGLVPAVVNTQVSQTGTAEVVAAIGTIPKSISVSVSPSIDTVSWQRAVDSTAAGLRKPVIELRSWHGGPTF